MSDALCPACYEDAPLGRTAGWLGAQSRPAEGAVYEICTCSAVPHVHEKLFPMLQDYLIKNVTEDPLKIVGGDLPVSQRDNICR